jgi:integrase
MASAYTRGKTVYVKYKDADGSYTTVSRDENGDKFTTELKGKKWGNGKEEEIRKAKHKAAHSPEPQPAPELTVPDMTFAEWFQRWWPVHAAGLSLLTRKRYSSVATVHLLPRFGHQPLRAITPLLVAEWQLWMRTEEYKPNTYNGARTLLALILGDAQDQGLIDSNPAERRGRRGRIVHDDNEDESEEKVWATPLQALLLAERAALMARPAHGFDAFVMVLLTYYTGMRFGEVAGLRWEWVRPGKVKVRWQINEDGPVYLMPPKRGSRRWIDIPPFLDELLQELRERFGHRVCTCKPRTIEGQREQPCQGGQPHVFLGPRGGHLRASNYRDRIWHPAVEGRSALREGDNPRPSRAVMVDMAKGWPGVPVRNPWPDAVEGEAFVIPRGRGIVDYDPARVHLASWVALLKGLTPHGLRHGHQVLIDDLPGVTEVLKKLRMGHRQRGMDHVYRHVSSAAVTAVKAGMQRVLEETVRQRFAISPTSPVPALDAWLKPLREAAREAQDGSCRKTVETAPAGRLGVRRIARPNRAKMLLGRTPDQILPGTLPPGYKPAE